YGSLVVVFQWGWLENLGFEPIGSIDSTIPPLVLAMTFGLSMDYEIFLLTRIRERYLQSGDTRDAVAYGVATSARTITSAALIMIAVFVGFAFAGMPLVAQLGVACAVAIAVDATVVRLVLVPALMAVFDDWNWWLPAWLARILPSVDFDKPLPKLDLGDLVVLPDDMAAVPPPQTDLRMVIKDAARLKQIAPDAVCVADPLALRGCGMFAGPVRGGDDADAAQSRRFVSTLGAALDRGLGASVGELRAAARTALTTPTAPKGAHPVTVWRGRLAVALDALETDAAVARRSPVETTFVQLPTGDRLQVPTAAETLRLKSYLVLCRNSRADYAELADLTEAIGTEDAAGVLAGIDRYYSSGRPERQPIATQLVRRLADPVPDVDDGEPSDGLQWDGERWNGERWNTVRQRCLALAVAMLEEPS
ncbi:MAG: MMPL family transporter, partial [Mycobacterium sp.]|nr:MMPL family transporter [Mycobacterium sp.]